ncbi:hypothetical protein HXX76_010508 [Chlamydomonas incerta]|uniref:RAP domain-containing protein n=1 Tax=Chlamydomonas incerta TaxID=51695 RepID=A0A835SJV6_CHLIN|nr:hypothetical protein HXX76_010508 [Chlamydomonas incerta]|eukprot:KAG2428364.1 hypothetical protein HXX76_010508 [Chlamydomonas incerta]
MVHTQRSPAAAAGPACNVNNDGQLQQLRQPPIVAAAATAGRGGARGHPTNSTRSTSTSPGDDTASSSSRTSTSSSSTSSNSSQGTGSYGRGDGRGGGRHAGGRGTDGGRDQGWSSAGARDGGGRGNGRGRDGGGRGTDGSSGRGRDGGGRGGVSGRGPPAARDPADDMSGCGSLAELRALVGTRLGVWAARGDVGSLRVAFHLVAKLSSGSGAGAGPAAAAARSASSSSSSASALLCELAAAYLPLVPRTRQAADCSLPLWALAKAGAGSSGSSSRSSGRGDAAVVAQQLQQLQQLAAALLRRLADPALLAGARPQELSNALWALGRMREDRAGAGPGPGPGAWDPDEQQHHVRDLAGAVAALLEREGAAPSARGFTAQALTNILWACAKLEYRDPALLQPLAAAAATAAAGMTGQALSNSLWALAALGCTGPQYQSAVAALCGGMLQRLRAGGSAAAAAGGLGQQEIPNVLWACAKLGHRDPTLLEPLAAAAAAAVAGMTSQGLSNSLWALAALGCTGPEYRAAVDVLAREAAGGVRGMAMQGLSNSLWALAALGCTGPQYQSAVAALCGEVQARLQAGGSASRGGPAASQQLSNLLWACAKLEYREPGLLQPLVDAAAAAATAVPGMTGQGLSNSLWALAALGCTGPEYRPAVGALCDAVLRQLRAGDPTAATAGALSPQALSNALWALEQLQLGAEQSGLVAALAAEGRRRAFAGFGPQELANSAWALARMGFGGGAAEPDTAPQGQGQQQEGQQWFAAAVAAALRPGGGGAMDGATPQAWSNLLYALALVRHQPPPELLDAGVAEAMRRPGSGGGGGGQDCASTLYALAVLRLRHAGLEAAVCDRLGGLLARGPAPPGSAEPSGSPGTLDPQALANSLWALAVLGGTSEPASLPAGSQAAATVMAVRLAREASLRPGAFAPEGLYQLWQVQQELGGEVAELLRSCPALQAGMHAAAEAARTQTAADMSSFQKQVAAALHRLQQGALAGVIWAVRTEVAVRGMLGRVDVVVVLRGGVEVAVEADGPVHFFANRRGDAAAVDGPTALRNTQLDRAFGRGALVCVPYWEWYELAPPQQEAYLLTRLWQLRLRLRLPLPPPLPVQ